MTSLTEATPTTEAFDHSDIAGVQSYQAVSHALATMTLVLHRDLPDAGVTRDSWLAVLREQTSALAYGDACDRCTAAGDPRVVYPYRVAIDQGWREAAYFCPPCGHEWNAWYSR